MKERDIYWDIIKGITIFLVVLGHCVQYGSGGDFCENRLFFDNPVFKAIYMFHMPLFIFVCGYFFYSSSSKRSLKEIIISKIKGILLPIISFSCLLLFINMCKYGIDFISVLSSVKSLFFFFYNNLWFLWTLLKISILVAIIQKYCKDSLWLYIAIFVLLFYIPDGLITYFDKFMYPFFLLGYFSAKKVLISYLSRINFCGLITIFILYILCYFLYDKDTYVYTSHYSLIGKEDYIKQILIDLKRLISGIIGLVFVLVFVKLIIMQINNKVVRSLKKICSTLGCYSLGIYALHEIIPIRDLTSFIIDFNLMNCICESIIITLLYFYISYLISKNRILNFIFLGGRI